MVGSIRLGLNGAAAAVDFGVEKGLGNISALGCKKKVNFVKSNHN